MPDYTKFTDDQLQYDLKDYTENASHYVRKRQGREVAEKIRAIMIEMHKRQHGEPLSR